MTDTDCPACEAGMKPILMTVDLQISSEQTTTSPKRKADLLRKAPEGFYAYLKERKGDQVIYQVVYLKPSRWTHVIGERSPVSALHVTRHEFLGWVHKIGTKFFPQLVDGQQRRKGSSSLKKATGRLLTMSIGALT